MPGNRSNTYINVTLKIVASRYLGPGWAARCLRRGVMAELEERGLLPELARASGAGE